VTSDRDSRRALVLVRNDVLHDARVLREARLLRDLGWDPLVVGVVTERAPGSTAEVAGVPVLRLAPGIRRRGSRRAQPGPGNDAGPASPGPAARRRPLYERLRRLAVTLDYYRRGIALVRARRPALVHANDYNTMWIGVAAKVLCGSSLVYDAHELWADRNGRPEWRRWLLACEAFFVRVADALVTTSPGYADELGRRYRISAPRVVRNIAEPGPSRPSDGPTPTEPTVAYVGGLLRGRGLEQAIDAAALIPELRLRLIGPGSDAYVEELRRRAVAAGVAERVSFEGAVAPDAVVSALAGAAAGLMLIQPICRSYELTLPNKLFEYAAAGVPILSSDLPVMATTIREAGLGEVVPPGDPEAIAGGIRRLLDPVRQTACREAAAAFAETNNWSREQDRLRDAYTAATRAADLG
jgi:glycosyltransferase involved in cell wall biosynthesis